MLKSAIKAKSQHAQMTKADQGPSAQTRAITTRQLLDPEISIIDLTPPKKPRWNVSNPGTSGSDDCSTDHENALDTEASASDDITSAALGWQARNFPVFWNLVQSRGSPYRSRGAKELSATAEQGVFNPEVNPPTSGAGVNSGLLKHQLFKRRYVPPLLKFKYKQFSSSRKTSLFRIGLLLQTTHCSSNSVYISLGYFHNL